MIAIFDNIQIGASHAPFTRAFTETVLSACPRGRLTIYSRKSHLLGAFSEASSLTDERVTFKTIECAFQREGSPTARFLHSVCTGRESNLVIFLSARPTDIWAAKLFRRRYPKLRCQIVLHGDLAGIVEPRSRNPLNGLHDLRSSLKWINHSDIRFLVLEPHIVANLVATLPRITKYVDVIHHPCVHFDDTWQRSYTGGAVRFGLVGIAGPSKGLDVFARLAKRINAESPSTAEFRIIGKLQAGWRKLDLSGISGPLPFREDWLPRVLFEREVANLHFVVLPYNMRYYAFSASGVLLDALRWRKPIIAFRTPVVDELRASFGDIGHICSGEEEMMVALRNLIYNFDFLRYEAQRRNLDFAYRARFPENVAGEYLQLLRARWGAAFASSVGAAPLLEGVHNI